MKAKKQQRLKDIQTRIKQKEKAEKQQNFNPDNIADMEDTGNLELDEDDLALMAAAQAEAGELVIGPEGGESGGSVKYSKSPVRKSENGGENDENTTAAAAAAANSSSSSSTANAKAAVNKMEENGTRSRKVGCANCVIV